MSVTSPSCHLCFWPTSYRLGFPTPSSLSLVNFLDWLIELSKVRTLLTRFLVYYERIALGNSQMEAIHRASTGKGTEWGCSASMSLQSMPLSPDLHVFTPLEGLWNPPVGFLWQLHYMGTVDEIIDSWRPIQCPVPLPSLKIPAL